MPKGADLHATGLSLVSVDDLSDLISDRDNVYVALEGKDDGSVRMVLAVGDVAPEGYVPMTEAFAQGIVDRSTMRELITLGSGLSVTQARSALAERQDGVSGLAADDWLIEIGRAHV